MRSTVEHVMTTDVAAVKRSVPTVAESLTGKGVSGVPVLDDGSEE